MKTLPNEGDSSCSLLSCSWSWPWTCWITRGEGGQPVQCGQRGEGGHNGNEKNDEEMVYKITKEKPFFFNIVWISMYTNAIRTQTPSPWYIFVWQNIEVIWYGWEREESPKRSALTNVWPPLYSFCASRRMRIWKGKRQMSHKTHKQMYQTWKGKNKHIFIGKIAFLMMKNI